MAKSKPKSERELLLINGIGEKFIHNYGDDFLGVIAVFKNPEKMYSA